MTYELAKELKDAGFPQDLHYNGAVFRERDKFLFHLADSDDYDTATGGYNHHFGRESTTAREGYVRIPTLSELIEACEDYVDFSLEWRIGFWTATLETNRFDEENLQYFEAKAEIPEEAVAKLWLSLMKSPKL